MFHRFKIFYTGLKSILFQFSSRADGQPNLPEILWEMRNRQMQLAQRLDAIEARLASRHDELASRHDKLAGRQDELALRQDEISKAQEEFAARLLGREIETIKKYLLELTGKQAQGEFEVVSDFKVAYESPDHVVPRGTKNDNSIYFGFNEKLYAFMKGNSPMRVLDMGCAGGGFVESLVEDGHDAIGIEGSDYSLLHKRAAWRVIPGRLFTCDISKPFTIKKNGSQMKFDVVTAWELMEHFRTEDLDAVFNNIRENLSDDGYFMCSVATFEDFDEATNTHYHQTVQPRHWWVERFEKAGFEAVEQNIIGKGDWLRGSGNLGAAVDWNEDQGLGFHLVLKKKK